MAVFGEQYSRLYDSFYGAKDYGSECDLLEALWTRTGAYPKRILDLGCGTGNHSIELARRGYVVTGVDRSPSMIAIAEGKARAAGVDIDLRVADLRELEVGSTFDAAISMFAVMGYLTTDAELKDALIAVRKHLTPGSTLVFDCWYGPAVMAASPQPRIHLHALTTDTRLFRLATPHLDTLSQLVTVDYHVLEVQGNMVVRECSESHRMRFFFPREIDLLLTAAGFSEVTLFPFGDLDRAPSEADWAVMVVAR